MQPNKTFRMTASVDGLNIAAFSNKPGGMATVFGSNTNNAARFLKIYDTATTPNVGTDIPKVTKYLAPSDDFDINNSGSPLVFNNGIAIAFTALAPDSDATPINAVDIMGLNISYY